MVERVINICDICEEKSFVSKRASTKCFICEKDICEEHNFGGIYSEVIIGVNIHNSHTFNIEIDDIFMDCCPDCIDILRGIMKEKGETLKSKLKIDLKNIKYFLLNEIKKKEYIEGI